MSTSPARKTARTASATAVVLPSAGKPVAKPAAKRAPMVKAAPVSAAAGAAAHAKPGQPVKVEALAKTGKPADKKLQAAALQSSKLPSKKQAKQQSKPVRDSFTMPQADFDLIAALKFRGLSLGRSIKKSELLRAGLLALSVFNDKALLSTLDKLEPVKMGRPKTGAASA